MSLSSSLLNRINTLQESDRQNESGPYGSGAPSVSAFRPGRAGPGGGYSSQSHLAHDSDEKPPKDHPSHPAYTAPSDPNHPHYRFFDKDGKRKSTYSSPYGS